MDGSSMGVGAPLSVVVPVHNEAGNIGALAREVAASLADWGIWELIVVDDASTDDSVARIRAAARTISQLRLIRHHRRRGQSTAMWNGVAAARHPWVVSLDGDLQNDPRDIGRLWAALGNADPGANIQLVIGHRHQRQDGVVRRWSSRIANGVRSRLLGDRTPDSGCGLRLFGREAFLALPYFDHMHRFLPALMGQLGYGVLSVPVSHRPRGHGQSKYGISNRLWAGLVDLVGVAWLARRNRRTAWTEELQAPPVSAPSRRETRPSESVVQ